MRRRVALALTVNGPTAAASGTIGDNLVLKAARALAERVDGLKLGRFVLTKRLPVAAGVGGGSADAAAALRLLARANRIALGDPRLMEAARVTGADVPVCLDPRPRVMRGIGEILSGPLALPRLARCWSIRAWRAHQGPVFAALRGLLQVPTTLRSISWKAAGPPNRNAVIEALAHSSNDLEAPAVALVPAIAAVLTSLRDTEGCRLARMSGSGATSFGLFDSAAAAAAARALRVKHPDWWIRVTKLG